MDKKREILKQAQRLADLFSAAVSIPVQIVPTQEKKAFYCCDLCRLLAESADLQCDCIADLTQHGKSAQNLGGVHTFFCPFGSIGFVSPVLYRGEPIAVAMAGPLLLNSSQTPSAEYWTNYFEFSVLKADEAERRMRYLPRLGAAQIHRFALLLQAVMKHSGVALLPHDYMNQTEEHLLNAVQTGVVQEAEIALKNGISQMFALHAGDEASLKNHCLDFSLLLCRVLSDCKLENKRTQRSFDALLLQLQSYRDTASLRLCMRRIYKLCLECFQTCTPKQKSKTICDAMEYVQKNYMAKITLESAAGHVYLTPSHLSKKFKEETGKHFNQYVNEVRIEKAKQMLRDSNAELTDIAFSIGFEDQSYFSRVFRRLEGMTPKEYRRAKNHSR